MTQEQANAKKYTDLKKKASEIEKELKALKGYFDTITGKQSMDIGTWLLKYTEQLSSHYDMKKLQSNYGISDKDLKKYQKTQVNFKIERI